MGRARKLAAGEELVISKMDEAADQQARARAKTLAAKDMMVQLEHMLKALEPKLALKALEPNHASRHPLPPARDRPRAAESSKDLTRRLNAFESVVLQPPPGYHPVPGSELVVMSAAWEGGGGGGVDEDWAARVRKRELSVAALEDKLAAQRAELLMARDNLASRHGHDLFFSSLP